MPSRYYSNSAADTTITSGMTNSQTTVTVASASGFPTSYPFTLVIEPGTASAEIVNVTSLSSGTTYNITRGQDGTSGVTHSINSPIRHMITARDLSEWQTAVDAINTAPSVSVYQTTTTTSFTTATDTAVGFNTELFDTHGFHDNATNNSRLTVPTGQGGLYHIEGTLPFASNTSGYREAVIRKNNVEVLRCRVQPLTSAVACYVPISGYIDLAAGDYIELWGYQNSGSTIASVSGTTWTRLQMIRVRDNV